MDQNHTKFIRQCILQHMYTKIKNLLQWLVVVVVSRIGQTTVFRIWAPLSEFSVKILFLSLTIAYNNRYGHNKYDYLCIIIPIKKREYFFLC